VFSRTEQGYRMSRSSAEKPAGESDHVECCHPSGRCVSQAGALREAAGVVSGTSGCGPVTGSSSNSGQCSGKAAGIAGTGPFDVAVAALCGGAATSRTEWEGSPTCHALYSLIFFSFFAGGARNGPRSGSDGSVFLAGSYYCGGAAGLAAEWRVVQPVTFFALKNNY